MGYFCSACSISVVERRQFGERAAPLMPGGRCCVEVRYIPLTWPSHLTTVLIYTVCLPARALSFGNKPIVMFSTVDRQAHVLFRASLCLSLLLHPHLSLCLSSAILYSNVLSLILFLSLFPLSLSISPSPSLPIYLSLSPPGKCSTE